MKYYKFYYSLRDITEMFRNVLLANVLAQLGNFESEQNKKM